MRCEARKNRIMPGTDTVILDVEVIVLCVNANGQSDFFFTTVNTTSDEFDDGQHYDKAIAEAKENGYDPPYGVMDDADPPWPHVAPAVKKYLNVE